MMDDLFTCKPVALSDEYSEMSDTEWSQMCKKYINELMMEQVVTEDKDENLCSRANFLISTLRAHHYCRTGKEIAVLPTDRGDFFKAREIVTKRAHKLLNAAGEVPHSKRNATLQTETEVVEVACNLLKEADINGSGDEGEVEELTLTNKEQVCC